MIVKIQKGKFMKYFLLSLFLIISFQSNANADSKDFHWHKDFYWYENAAKNGDVNAQATLGLAYFEGEEIAQDYKKAFYWLEKAAKQGEVYAQGLLGHMYIEGLGAQKNPKKAFYWLEKAAKQGEPSIQGYLGMMYYRGDLGTQMQYVHAYKWLYLSFTNKDFLTLRKDLISITAELIRKLESSMTPDEIAKAKKLASELKTQ